jgi:Holliday junction resolvase RusA-like endonuclease
MTFTVFGIAQTKGSTRAFVPKGWTRPVITNSNRNAKSWEALIAHGAGEALLQHGRRGVVFLGPMRLAVAFHLPRPKGLPKTKDTAHVKAPDCDKCARCVLDALSGVVYRDDAQVVRLEVSKQYAALGDSPRAEITIEPLGAAERLFTERDHVEHSQAETAAVSPD